MQIDFDSAESFAEVLKALCLMVSEIGNVYCLVVYYLFVEHKNNVMTLSNI